MEIHRNNYEAYFLDYLEGRLSEQEIALLLAFLEKNPDLEDELYQFENITLKEHDINLKNKEVMFKSTEDYPSVNEQNFPEFCVAHFENQLGQKGEQMLKRYLELNPSLIKEYNLYGKVFLEADSAQRMPGKSQLRHITFSPARRWMLTASAVAAILLFALLLLPLRNKTITLQPQTAAVNASNQAQTPVTAPVVAQAPTVKKGNRALTKTFRKSPVVASVPADSINGPQVGEVRENILLAALAPVEVHSLGNAAGKPDLLPARIILLEKPVKGSRDNHEYEPLFDYALAEVRNKMKDRIPSGNDNGKLSWWGIAEYGVKGFNQLTGSNLRLERRTDNNGKEILALGAGKLEITAPLR